VIVVPEVTVNWPWPAVSDTGVGTIDGMEDTAVARWPPPGPLR